MARRVRSLAVSEALAGGIKLTIGLAVFGVAAYFGYNWWTTRNSTSPDERMYEKLEDKTFTLAGGETRTGVVGVGQSKTGSLDTSFKYEFEVECLDGEVGIGSTGSRGSVLRADETGAVLLKRVAKGKTEGVSGYVQAAGLEGDGRTYYHWIITNSSKDAKAVVHMMVKRRK